jgi:hypothetical protein
VHTLARNAAYWYVLGAHAQTVMLAQVSDEDEGCDIICSERGLSALFDALYSHIVSEEIQSKGLKVLTNICFHGTVHSKHTAHA